jgi:hypothetical protein
MREADKLDGMACELEEGFGDLGATEKDIVGYLIADGPGDLG